MKINDLINELIGIEDCYGDISVYTLGEDWGIVKDPFIRISEGGSATHPYPGLYLE